ncbi:hypothetical protein AAMO2058_000603400 [Amorphochlora amoebiformis]
MYTKMTSRTDRGLLGASGQSVNPPATERRGKGGEGGVQGKDNPLVQQSLRATGLLHRTTTKREREIQSHIEAMDSHTRKEVNRLLDDRKRRLIEIDRLNNRLRAALDANREQQKQHANEISQAVSAVRKEYEPKVNGLRKQNTQMEKELEDLKDFKAKKHAVSAELAETKASIRSIKLRHLEEIKAIDRKHSLMKEDMMKDVELRIKIIKQKSREGVLKETHIESQRLRLINQQMSDEIRFHVKGNNSLRSKNEKIKTKLKQAKLDLSLLKDENELQTVRSAKHNEKIKKLKRLNESLKDEVRGLRQELGELREGYIQLQRDSEAPTQEIRHLRNYLAIKNNEVLRMKRLAKTILDQRGDVERFFLKALEQVKFEIRLKRDRERKLQKKVETLRLLSLTKGRNTTLPPMGPSSNKHGLAEAEFAKPAHERRVDLADLEPEDRERVLRLLFSKINTVVKEKEQHTDAEYSSYVSRLHTGVDLTERPASAAESKGVNEDVTDGTFLTNYSTERNNTKQMDLSTTPDPSTDTSIGIRQS